MPNLRVGRCITKVVVCGALMFGAATPARAQGVARSSREPARPLGRLSESVHALRDSIVALTKRQLGIPYRFGAASPERGFDCSGLATYVMSRFGIRLPRTSGEQALVGKKIARDLAALRPGDLLTFGRGRRITHVGIYIGGGRFVHAPARGTTVREESLAHVAAGWWKGARRIIVLADTGATAPAPVN